MKFVLLINLKLQTITNSFSLNIAEHEIFSANKYENANNSLHFHIYLQRKFHAQLSWAWENFYNLRAWSFFCQIWGWFGGGCLWRRCRVSYITRGVQLILAYSWARPAILVVDKGRWGMFLFLLFLHFRSCSSFSPSLSFISSAISSISLLPFSGRRHETTHNVWRVVKLQHNQNTSVRFKQENVWNKND